MHSTGAQLAYNLSKSSANLWLKWILLVGPNRILIGILCSFVYLYTHLPAKLSLWSSQPISPRKLLPLIHHNCTVFLHRERLLLSSEYWICYSHFQFFFPLPKRKYHRYSLLMPYIGLFLAWIPYSNSVDSFLVFVHCWSSVCNLNAH